MVDSIPSEGEAAAHVHASPEWTWTGGRGTSVADSIPLEGEAAAHVHASPEWTRTSGRGTSAWPTRFLWRERLRHNRIAGRSSIAARFLRRARPRHNRARIAEVDLDRRTRHTRGRLDSFGWRGCGTRARIAGWIVDGRLIRLPYAAWTVTNLNLMTVSELPPELAFDIAAVL